MFKFILLFLSNLDKLQDTPGDISSGPGGSKNQGVENDLKFLREDESGSVTKDKKETEGDISEEEEEEEETPEEEAEEVVDDEIEGEEEEEESEEESEEEEEIEGEEEEEETEEEEPDENKITVKGIKKNFPDFFKKHPEMKGVIFRERQFSEVFNTPQDAQYAARLANQFQVIETDLMNGDTAPLIDAMKKANGGKNYESFISNFLPSLQKTDADAYYKVVAVPLKRALRAAFKSGMGRGDKAGENLAYAAQHIHNYLFDNVDLDEKADFETKAKPTEKSKEQKEYEEKLEQINARDYKVYKNSVDEEWVAGVSDAFLDGLDPDNILSDWTKKKMVEEAVASLNRQMTKDTRYMASVNNLWLQARNSGWDQSFKTRIVNTSLARAKQIIPTIRQKLRAEALNERRRVTKLRDGKKGSKHEVRRVVSGRESNGRKVLSKKEMSKMSDLDIIRS